MAVIGQKRRTLWIVLGLVIFLCGGLWYFFAHQTVLRADVSTPLHVQAASAPHLPNDDPKVVRMSDFLPWQDGLQWAYRVRSKDGQISEQTIKQTLVGDTLTFSSNFGDQSVLVHQDEATLMTRQTFTQSGIEFVFSPALQLYPDLLPMATGHRYDGPLTAKHPLPGSPGTGQVHWQVVPEGWQDVQTPAGEFKDCLRLKVTMSVSLNNYLSVSCQEYRWLARNIGQVRCKNAFRIELAGIPLAAQENTIELCETNAGKKK